MGGRVIDRFWVAAFCVRENSEWKKAEEGAFKGLLWYLRLSMKALSIGEAAEPLKLFSHCPPTFRPVRDRCEDELLNLSELSNIEGESFTRAALLLRKDMATNHALTSWR